MAKIREVKAIGACTSTLEKNIITLAPKSKSEDKFGAEFVSHSVNSKYNDSKNPRTRTPRTNLCKSKKRRDSAFLVWRF